MSLVFRGSKFEEGSSPDGSYVHRSKEWESFRKKKKYDLAIKEANLSFVRPEFTFETYSGEDKEENLPKLKEYIKDFKKRYKHFSLYLHGDHTTQKTITAGIVGREILKQGCSVCYTTMTELHNLILASIFTREEKYSLKLKKISYKEFLIIDRSFSFDMGKKFITELYAFLRKRLEEDRRATCFIASQSMKNLDELKFTKNIYPVIRRSCYPMVFKDIINDFDIDYLFSDIKIKEEK